VLGQNVTQAAQFAESGAADAALIALSVALAPGLQKEGHFVEVPEGGPIAQGVILLKHSRQPEAAEAFQKFVLGGEGRGILKQFGLAPEE
jgi:molybdate transport system substrate-binding protein